LINPTGFARPSFDALLAQSRADYASRIPDGDVMMRQGALPVFPAVDAAAQNALHAHLDWSARQGHPLFAEGDWLNGWAAVWGVTRKPATAAAGNMDMTGTTGAVIPVGAAVRRVDGTEYTVTAETTLVAGVAVVPVQAAVTGVTGNALAAVQLSLTSPIIGVNSRASVTVDALTGGADSETDIAFRARVLERIQSPPHGGNATDYVTWAMTVPGVTRVWIEPAGQGLGTVVVRFMMDDTYANGIPIGDPGPNYTGDLLAVFDALDPVRPVTADLIIVAPAPVVLDVTITGLDPDTATIRAEIEAELADMIRRRAAPGVTIRLSWIWEAVSIASGEDSHEITAPVVDVIHATGEIAVLGTVTYA